MKIQRRSTINDVAKMAGVTNATVSLVVHNNRRISKETKAKVQAVIKQLRYTPNEAARMLVKRHNTYIGIIFPFIDDPFFTDILSEAYEKAEGSGYTLLIYLSRGEIEKEQYGVHNLISRGIAGLILYSVANDSSSKKDLSYFQELKHKRIPVVMIDRRIPGGNYPFISVDNFRSGQLIAEHLIGLGHRSLLFVYNEDCGPVNERYEGFFSVISKVPGAKVQKLRETGNTGVRSEFVPEKQTLEDLVSTCTAVFAVSDYSAIRFMKVLQDMGLKIPEDMSIVGMDDLHFSSYVTPSLTTIRYDKSQLGSRSISLIIELDKKRNMKKTATVILEPELVIRNSTAPVRKK